MNWVRQTSPVPCTSCGHTIAAGCPARVLTKSRGQFCAGCAQRRLMELVPATITTHRAGSQRVYVGEGRSTDFNLERFNRAATAGDVRNNILSFRELQRENAKDGRLKGAGGER